MTIIYSDPNCDQIYPYDFANTSLQFRKNNNYLNGVTTQDMVLIKQHVLGLKKLDFPYAMIAANVNQSGYHR